MDEWMNGWMDGWRDGGTEELLHALALVAALSAFGRSHPVLTFFWLSREKRETSYTLNSS